MDSTPKHLTDEQRTNVMGFAKRMPFAVVAAFFALIASFTGNFPMAVLLLASSSLFLPLSSDKANRRRSIISRAASFLLAGIAVAGLLLGNSPLLIAGIVAYLLADVVQIHFTLKGMDEKPNAVAMGFARFVQVCYLGFAVFALLVSPKGAVIMLSLFDFALLGLVTLFTLIGVAAIKASEKLDTLNVDRTAGNGKVIKGEVIDSRDDD